jgi:hypothetical protein
MAKIIAGIFYWGLMAFFAFIFSPILVPMLLVQCFIDVGLRRAYISVLNTWLDLEKEMDQEARAKRGPNGTGKRYADTLDYENRERHLEIAAKHGYDPDADVGATQHRRPYRPNIKLPCDEALRAKLANKWRNNADSIADGKAFTQSYWDIKGSTLIEEIFLQSYRVPNIDIFIENAIEHCTVVETWAMPYYDVEYNYLMLLRAHDLNPKLSTNKEFIIRYKLVNMLFKRLNELYLVIFGAFEKGDLTTSSTRKTQKSSGVGVIDAWYWWMETNLFLDQCEYFKNEARKGRNV